MSSTLKLRERMGKSTSENGDFVFALTTYLDKSIQNKETIYDKMRTTKKKLKWILIVCNCNCIRRHVLIFFFVDFIL